MIWNLIDAIRTFFGTNPQQDADADSSPDVEEIAKQEIASRLTTTADDVGAIVGYRVTDLSDGPIAKEPKLVFTLETTKFGDVEVALGMPDPQGAVRSELEQFMNFLGLKVSDLDEAKGETLDVQLDDQGTVTVDWEDPGVEYVNMSEPGDNGVERSVDGPITAGDVDESGD